MTLTLGGTQQDLLRNAANTAWVARRDAPQLEVRQIGDDLHLYDGEGRTYIFSPQGAGSLLINGNLYLLVQIRGSGGNKMVFEYGFAAPTLPGGRRGLAIDLVKVSYNPHPSTNDCFKHSVLFGYDTPSPSSPPLSMSMLGGTVLARIRKLDKVDVLSRTNCTSNPTELRTYEFSYQPDIDTQLPRLQSVTMKGQNGTPERSIALPVATYGYGTISNPSTRAITYQLKSIAVPSGSANHSASGISYSKGQLSTEPHGPNDQLIDLFGDQAFIDINGDGRVDFGGDGGWFMNAAGSDGSTVFSPNFVGFGASHKEKIHSAVLDVDPNMPARVNTVVNDTLSQFIDMNGDGRLDIVQTSAQDIDNWTIFLNKPHAFTGKWTELVSIAVPVTRMRQALGTTGLTFGRVPMARRTTIAESFTTSEPGNKRKRTITEFELKDVNGDGYPDFVYNASFVARSAAQGPTGDMTGTRNVMVMINTAGAHLAPGTHLFASPRILVNGALEDGCGISRWEADSSDVKGGILNETCGIEDINGDGLVDRITSIMVDAQLISSAALGTGVATQPFATNVRITLPGPLSRTETALTLVNGVYMPTACVSPNPEQPTFDIRRSRALRDINGDGIPDYISGQIAQNSGGTWTVAVGTGVGFAAPTSVGGLPITGLEPSRERSTCATANTAGQVSATPTGLYDIDGDGQPEIVNMDNANPTAPLLRVYKLQQAALAGQGVVGTLPGAGRLVRIDNGYNASTYITYKSAKEDTLGFHNIPSPEIVVADVTIRNQTGAELMSSTRYAYSNASSVFDSVRDAFVFPGYLRSVRLVGTDPLQAGNGMATFTDLHGLDAFSAAGFPDAAARFKRYQKLGQVKQETTFSGNLGTDAWALVTANVIVDNRRIAGTHFDYDVKLLTAGVKPTNNEVCVDMMFPYDFTLSQANALSNDQCTQVGFVFQKDTRSWRGEPGTASDPFASPLTVKTRSEVQEMDTLGRITRVAHHNDMARSDDDLCKRTTYATPNGSNERVLSAAATRTVTAGNCAANPEITLTSETWEYDTSSTGAKLPAGKVAAGFVTSHIVSRRKTDTGAAIVDAEGNSDLRQFDAVYSASGNATTITSRRDDGAVRKITATYDAFDLAPLTTQVDATNEDGNTLPPLLTTNNVDSLTLMLLDTTDPNGMQSGNTFDGFGRVLLSTVKPVGASAVGALSSIGYQGFATSENRDRRIVQKVFADPVPLDTASTAAGRTGTTFLDQLGRTVRTEVQMGADYPNQIMHVGRRTYDLLGRVSFEADPYPFPSMQNSTTAYGTSYHFYIDGTPSCTVRGRGPQPQGARGDETREYYLMCFERTYADDKLTTGVMDAVTLSDFGSHQLVEQSTYSAIGRLLNQAKVDVGTLVRLESMDFAHDALGNVTRMARAAQPGSATSATVDTTWKYDSLGQVLELSEPGSATLSRSYDTWGGMTQGKWTDTTTSAPSERRIIQKYDALGRLVHSEERTDNVVDAETVNDYVYDRPMNPATPSVPAKNVLGRLAKATSPTSATSFSYDGFGRVNAQVFTDTSVNPPQVYVETRTFDGDGNPSSVAVLLPDANHRSEQVTYTYDSARRTRSAIYTDGTITQNLFVATAAGDVDVFGRIRRAQYGGAAFTADFAETGRRLINSAKVTAPSGALREIAYPALNSLTPAFDPLGRERARRETTNSDPARTIAYTYGNIGQLTASTRTPVSNTLPDMAFDYDALGNVTLLNATVNASDARLSYQTEDRDRICSIAYGGGNPGTSCDVKYDGVGNIVQQPSPSNGVRRFTYFINGLVKRVTDGNGNDARFRYDAFGELQQLDLTSNTSPDTRKDRHFGGMMSQREEVVNGVKKTVTLRSFSAPGLTATRHGGAAADPWTFTFGEARGNRFFTNQAGEFVQDVDYQAYGEAKSSGAVPGAPSYGNRQFNSGDALSALGLSQLGARLYDPAIGRFLSRDPLIVPRTAAMTNPYAFAANDPVNFSDPTGLMIAVPRPERPPIVPPRRPSPGVGTAGTTTGPTVTITGGPVTPWNFGPDTSYPMPPGFLHGDDDPTGGRGPVTGGSRTGGGFSGGKGDEAPPSDAQAQINPPSTFMDDSLVPLLHNLSLALTIMEHLKFIPEPGRELSEELADSMHNTTLNWSVYKLIRYPSLETAWDVGNEYVDKRLLTAGWIGIGLYGVKKGIGMTYRAQLRANEQSRRNWARVELKVDLLNKKVDSLLLDGGYSEPAPVYGPQWPNHGPYAPRPDEVFLRVP